MDAARPSSATGLGDGAGGARPTAPDQRRSPRRSVQGVSCRVQSGARWLWVPATIIDFSTKGVRLRTPLGWESGQTRRLRITAGSTRLELAASCIWARQEGNWQRVVGAGFQGTTPAQDALLAELLARHGVEPLLAQAA